MTTEASDLDLGILLGLAYTRFIERLNAAMADAGFDDLGRWYGYVFRALATRPMSLSELATTLDMTSQGAMKIIDEMEARGYVERTADPADGRVKRLRLAARGRRALARARTIHRALEAELGDARAKRLRALLADLVVVEDGTVPLLRPM